MHLFALAPETSDFLTVWGFIVGVVGLVVGVAGFWIAIVQIREARKEARKGKEAAEAARDAANKTLAESKDAYERFVGAFALRFLSELRNAKTAEDWKFAALRCQDLADLLGTIATEQIRELREFGTKFTKRANREKPAFSEVKWERLLHNLHAQLDRINAPFREAQHGSGSVNNTAGEVSGDRANTPGEDKSKTSELGEKPEN